MLGFWERKCYVEGNLVKKKLQGCVKILLVQSSEVEKATSMFSNNKNNGSCVFLSTVNGKPLQTSTTTQHNLIIYLEAWFKDGVPNGDCIFISTKTKGWVLTSFNAGELSQLMIDLKTEN